MIVIVGAGIAGLSIGWALVKKGHAVTLVDAGPVAGKTSRAATAYLEPRLGDTPIKLLEREALARWECYARDLETFGGSVGFRKEGQIRVALPGEEARFAADLQARRALDWQVEDLSPNALSEREKVLSPAIVQAAWLPQVRSVDGRAVCRALAHAIVQGGGTICENWEVSTLRQGGDGLVLSGRHGEEIQAEKVLLATGHVAHHADGVPNDVPQTRPVRGVNLIYDRADLPIHHLIKHHRGTLCPRGGSVLVGTTYEAGETALVPDEAVIERLLSNAEGIVPQIRRLPIREVAVGLRAKVGDGTLALGRSTALPGLYWSLGHAGAGYLRAPVIGEEVACFVARGSVGPWLQQARLIKN